jgi:hypothetical protein
MDIARHNFELERTHNSRVGVDKLLHLQSHFRSTWGAPSKLSPSLSLLAGWSHDAGFFLYFLNVMVIAV